MMSSLPKKSSDSLNPGQPGLSAELAAAPTSRGVAAVDAPRAPQLPAASQAFLDNLIQLKLLSRSSAHAFLEQKRSQLAELANVEHLGSALVRAGLLTEYQVDRVLAGTTHGLVLGNYCVLQRIGSGGMGVVFLAEHCLMKRRVAVKVLPVDDDCPDAVRERFYTEMRGLADLHHPHIVTAYDAGELPAPAPNLPTLIYLVMELLTGGDLEEYVIAHGPRPIHQACAWVRQAACGLQEAHDHHLIHRDVKPSNLLLTAQGQIKVSDFGLVRQFCSQLTDPRVLLGSIDFIAPEQSHDPSAVGAEADIYGLGATLFWLLSGEPPYPRAKSLGAALRQLQQDPPRRLRQLRPEAPAALDELIARLLDRDPARRPALPLNVMNELAAFNQPPPASGAVPAAPSAAPTLTAAVSPSGHRVLIVDDEEPIRRLCRAVLEPAGCTCDEAPDGTTALALAAERPYDLLLLDLALPDMDGYAVCQRLRRSPPTPNFKVIVVSGRGDQNELAESLPQGADDYVPKPFQPRQLTHKVQHALRLKEAQDRADQLASHLQLTNRQLEQSLHARAADVRAAQDALLFTMARMAESHDGETEGHLRRMQLYCRVLAAEAAREPPWQGLVEARFLENLHRCVPLHDIGKIELPDQVLLKPGRLTPSERALVETHPVIGDRILQALGRAHGQSLPFFGMATAIVRHHHERFDGQGYPDKLAGDAIPAAARLVAVADVYEALRRQRPYKPALSHLATVRVMLEECRGHFDPILLRAFRNCEQQFDRIYREVRD
jgi:response regulator RpfG family c-di-GMP phosphodiesterase/tRNA A-37 threonylcarbamoyl transferase component Bud32